MTADVYLEQIHPKSAWLTQSPTLGRSFAEGASDFSNLLYRFMIKILVVSHGIPVSPHSETQPCSSATSGPTVATVGDLAVMMCPSGETQPFHGNLYWLVVTGCHEFGIFPEIWGFDHHPNWRTHIFQRGGEKPPTSLSSLNPNYTFYYGHPLGTYASHLWERQTLWCTDQWSNQSTASGTTNTSNHGTLIPSRVGEK